MTAMMTRPAGATPVDTVPGAPPPVPWLRPGVVMHEPTFPVDRLLADFAGAIQRRGFAVKGFVRRDHTPGEGCAPNIELIDLSDGRIVRIDRHAGAGGAGVARAVTTLRQATPCATGCRPAFRC